MIDLYFWTTDNGYKARMGVEETGVDYTIKPIELPKRQNMEPEYLKINPSHKIPAIVDPDGPGGQTVTLFESGAILRYLAMKTDSPLYPTDPMKQLEVEQWLMWGSATYTTLQQQLGFFRVRNKEDVPQATKHYDAVCRDLLGVMDGHLADNEYLSGDYSIADISCYPDTHLTEVSGIELDSFPNVSRWHDAIAARPAVQKAWGPY